MNAAIASGSLRATRVGNDSGQFALHPFGLSENEEIQKSKADAQPWPQRANGSESTRRRRRTLRACDECRRKKIKCDGKKPCRHCDEYSYECTYDDALKRGRNASPRHIEAVGVRLQRAESLLRILEPSLDLKDLYLNTTNPQHIAWKLRRSKMDSKTAGHEIHTLDAIDDSPPGIMIDNIGFLDLDDKGQWDYNGHSSTATFVQRLTNRFGDLVDPVPVGSRSEPMSQTLEGRPYDVGAQQDGTHLPNVVLNCKLPPKTVARDLCQTSFDEACILICVVHEPSFWTSFEKIYATEGNAYCAEGRSFLPLMYAVMAVGCLFSGSESSKQGFFKQGSKYLEACRALLDLTDCRDLTSLQTIIFLILFFQSSKKPSACYPYIGIAQRAALRLGLHRKIQGNFTPIERELRKRIFWAVHNMDVYASTRLGLPISINSEEIDQEYPLEIDDEFITAAGITSMPSDRTSSMAAVNAHSRLLDIIIQVIKNIYPVKLGKHKGKPGRTFIISYSKIQQIEADLQMWMNQLPFDLQAQDGSPASSSEIERIRKLIHLAHAHVQWIMYRPFLHFISKAFQAKSPDSPLYVCATACVGASIRIIQIARSMYEQGFLNGAFWFPMQAMYYATLTLIYFVIENRELATCKQDAIDGAFEGKRILEALVRNGFALERCSRFHSLFKHLSEKINHSNDNAVATNHDEECEQFRGQPSTSLPVDTPPSLLYTAPTISTFDNSLDQPVIEQPFASVEQHETSEKVSDLLQIFMSPEPEIQPENPDSGGFTSWDTSFFDEMFTHLGMDIFDTSYEL